MKTLKQIQTRQKDFIQQKITAAEEFISTVVRPHKEILSCLLSGSVARGDFWPGDRGGATDLTLFVEDLQSFNAVEILGKDLEPDIPGHFIFYKENYYQIRMHDSHYLDHFIEQPEAEKYAFSESKLLFVREDSFEIRLKELREKIMPEDIKKSLSSDIGYTAYLINPYKTDRWRRRDAVIQLNQNLSTAITIFIKGLYHLNMKYTPAEDRALYYSFSLPQKPENYEEIMEDLLLIKSRSLEDYERREALFKEKFLSFLKQ